MWAIVPFKALEAAKQRLAGLLTPPERKDLMLTMAHDVLTALSQSSALSGVLIVSRTPEADALAAKFGAERFHESQDADLPGALTEASSYLSEHHGARGIMVVPADVPLLEAGDIDAVLAGHDLDNPTGAVTVVPDSAQLGTNALVLSPPGIIDFIFDGKSFKPHVDAAFAAGLTPEVASARGFELDIDTAEDLRILLARSTTTQTGTFLEKSGIAARLNDPDNDEPEINP